MLKNRYRRITRFFARIIWQFIFWELILPKVGLRNFSSQRRLSRLQTAARRYRALATDMGGVLIKIGQWFSARADILPKIVTDELAGLQDEVRKEKFEDIRRVAEQELGRTLEDAYAWFNETPIAAASIGQAHKARLHPADAAKVGYEDIVVKVQRPQIEQIINIDLEALATVAKWLMRYKPISKRADVPALLREFSRTLYEEIDYMAEGKHGETFAKNFENRKGIQVPAIVWSHTARKVITQEEVKAIKITDYAAIEAAGLDRHEIAIRMVEAYLEQIFSDSFFHADPHPGNLFVSPTPVLRGNPKTTVDDDGWQLIFIDFGMVGHISPSMRKGLREMALAVISQDSTRLIQAYQHLGVILPGADISALERAGATLFERFWGKSTAEIRDISFEETEAFAAQFRDLIYELPFQVPEDLIFFGRTLEILSGISVGLFEQFNVWESVIPITQRLFAEEAAEARFGLDEVVDLGRLSLSIPRQASNVLDKLDRGRVEFNSPRTNLLIERLTTAVERGSIALVFIGLLLGGIQLLLAEMTTAGYVLLGGAAIALWRVVFGNRVT